MRFDSSKVWPHPVLRPPKYGDDYPHAKFEVEIELLRIHKSTAIQLVVSHRLSDPTLNALLDQKKARFSVLIKSRQTQTRELLSSTTPKIECEFPAGQLAGYVEVTPFLVCTERLTDFQCNGWHSDFDGYQFDLDPGSILAEDLPKSYWIDTADEAPLGSIFAHKVDASLKEGAWDLNLHDNHVVITMCEADERLYKSARDRIGISSEGQYLMNGLYLPALLTTLHQADESAESYEDYRWFSSLNERLQSVGGYPLGNEGSNRLFDAQKLLDFPFIKMPIIAYELHEGT